MGAALAGGGGQSLGTAQGSIIIDTRDLQTIAAPCPQIGGIDARTLGQIDLAAKKNEASFIRLSKTIGGLRTELAGIGILGGVISAVGIKTAASFEEAAVMLRGMTGGIEQANKLVADLRKQAAAAGLPFADMLQVARRLLPTFEGNTKELERWYDIVKRVAVLNQQEGVSGAAFSINEAITSGGRDLVSLVERFNISRAQIRAELANNGNDFFAALDKVLNRMGITTQTAEDMAKTFNASFRVAKDAALQLLAEGFTPLIQMMTPLLQQSAEWLATLRQTNPQVALLGAGLATVAVVGAPTLLLFNQLVEAGQKLQALGILGALGRAGLGGLAVGAGVGLGIGATNAIGRATGNEQMAGAGLSDLFLTIRKLISNMGFVISEITLMIRTGLVRALQAFISTIASFNNALGGMLNRIGASLPARLGGDLFSSAGASLQGMAAMGEDANAQLDAFVKRFTKENRAGLRSFIEMMVPGTFTSAGPGRANTANTDYAGGFDAAQKKAIEAWAKGIQEIERQAAQARLDATRQYEQQRTQAIAQHELQIARDAEDFARNRARAIAAHERQIADIREDAARREAEWQRDFNERTAKIREDSGERIAKIEKDFAKDRERAQRDHRDRLMDAAARLDAVAVVNEQKQFAKQQKDADEAHTERLTTERENLAERLAEEEKSHKKRLDTAREADTRRLADMQEAFALQQAQEDEDREIRLQRQADDFERQQELAAQAQAERLAQIDRQAAEQRRALDESFIEELNQLGIHRDAWLREQDAQQKASLELFKQFWIEFGKLFPNDPGPIQGPRPNAFPNSWAELGVGSAWSARSGAAVAASGGSTRNVSFAPGSIVVNGAAGQSEDVLARAVRREMELLLIEAGN